MQKEKNMTKPYEQLEQIARICHAANRAYCRSIGEIPQKPWDELNDKQRNATIEAVIFIIDHPSAGTAAPHEEWLNNKMRDGWRYGPSKDLEKKEHPGLVPYAELPPEQWVKDALFKAIIQTLVRPGT
jgi:hypothetical protein